jgi:hypothetical protein
MSASVFSVARVLVIRSDLRTMTQGEALPATRVRRLNDEAAQRGSNYTVVSIGAAAYEEDKPESDRLAD